MKVGIVANAEQQEEVTLKKKRPGVQLIFVNNYLELKPGENYDIFFFLYGKLNDINIKFFEGKPVFINEVIKTLEQIKLPLNFNRINGWPGFLKRETWEVVTGDKNIVGKVFEALGWNIAFIKDTPGLVAARVISMIINEAYYALEENVSSVTEIDLAMKLGTNYPYGPFEWQEKIGLQNIYELLHELSLTDRRYSVSHLLEKKYLSIISQNR